MNISFLFVTLVPSMIPYLAIRNLLRPGIVFDSISLEKLVHIGTQIQRMLHTSDVCRNGHDY